MADERFVILSRVDRDLGSLVKRTAARRGLTTSELVARLIRQGLDGEVRHALHADSEYEKETLRLLGAAKEMQPKRRRNAPIVELD